MFIERGYESFTVAEIADYAGLTKRTSSVISGTSVRYWPPARNHTAGCSPMPSLATMSATPLEARREQCQTPHDQRF
ncbi:helix-turn-helix domain-containing protein [Mycolicibacterium sp. 120266]|uniref:helix-turn-helix domain-containing protein n=1 Tax=Mycolicibacterium sp. 120266 TaxID=3090601 RepID=UPI0039A4A289